MWLPVSLESERGIQDNLYGHLPAPYKSTYSRHIYTTKEPVNTIKHFEVSQLITPKQNWPIKHRLTKTLYFPLRAVLETSLSHYNQQQFFSELLSPERSQYTIKISQTGTVYSSQHLPFWEQTLCCWLREKCWTPLMNIQTPHLKSVIRRHLWICLQHSHPWTLFPPSPRHLAMFSS